MTDGRLFLWMLGSIASAVATFAVASPYSTTLAPSSRRHAIGWGAGGIVLGLHMAGRSFESNPWMMPAIVAPAAMLVLIGYLEAERHAPRRTVGEALNDMEMGRYSHELQERKAMRAKRDDTP